MPYEPSPFLRSLPLFAEDEHQPFRKSARGAMRGAALLVHGFPGTPADMRPLAASLAAAGWDVDAPLLPGFGPQIITLPNRHHAEWTDVVAERVRSLRDGARQGHRRGTLARRFGVHRGRAPGDGRRLRAARAVLALRRTGSAHPLAVPPALLRTLASAQTCGLLRRTHPAGPVERHPRPADRRPRRAGRTAGVRRPHPAPERAAQDRPCRRRRGATAARPNARRAGHT